MPQSRAGGFEQNLAQPHLGPAPPGMLGWRQPGGRTTHLEGQPERVGSQQLVAARTGVPWADPLHRELGQPPARVCARGHTGHPRLGLPTPGWSGSRDPWLLFPTPEGSRGQWVNVRGAGSPDPRVVSSFGKGLGGESPDPWDLSSSEMGVGSQGLVRGWEPVHLGWFWAPGLAWPGLRARAGEERRRVPGGHLPLQTCSPRLRAPKGPWAATVGDSQGAL